LQADEHASWGPLPEPLVAVDDNVGNNP